MATIVTSTSERRSALVPNSPPKPEPITTTWWRPWPCRPLRFRPCLASRGCLQSPRCPDRSRSCVGPVACLTPDRCPRLRRAPTVTTWVLTAWQPTEIVGRGRARNGIRALLSGATGLVRLTTGRTSLPQLPCRPPRPAWRPVPLEPARPHPGLGSPRRAGRRRWVVRTCTEIGRAELAECAELGVSELVTNALLHGEPPITVRVRGTVEHPRVEVRDSSVEAPILPTAADDGRARRAAAHLRARPEHRGALLRRLGRRDRGRRQGRLVRAGRRVRRRTGRPGRDHRRRPLRGPREPTSDRVRVQILDVPLRLYIGFQHHFRELRREVRLLALAHEPDYPLAKSLSDLFAIAGPPAARGHRRRADRGGPVAAERTDTDLVVHMPRATARDAEPLRRAARPGRRVLPRRSGCSRWPAAPSSGSSRPGSSASSCARPTARRRCRGWTEPMRSAEPRQLVS